MKFWTYDHGMFYEKPERVMFCGECGAEVEWNPTLYCDDCLANSTFSMREERRLARLAGEEPVHKTKEYKRR